MTTPRQHSSAIRDTTHDVRALRKQRRANGLCPRCGNSLESEVEINQLTGRPLLRDGSTVTITACSKQCGYIQRPPARSHRQ